MGVNMEKINIELTKSQLELLKLILNNDGIDYSLDDQEDVNGLFDAVFKADVKTGNSDCQDCSCFTCDEEDCGFCPGRMHRCEECDY